MAADSNVAFPSQSDFQNLSAVTPFFDRDIIEDVPDETDETAWQDFQTYCSEVRS
jgi:hypothetical protein